LSIPFISVQKEMILFSLLVQRLLTNRWLNEILEDSRIKKDGQFLNKHAVSLRTLAKTQKLDSIAEHKGQALAQIALSCVYSREGITSTMIRALIPEPKTENLKKTNNIEFTEQEHKEIDSIVL